MALQYILCSALAVVATAGSGDCLADQTKEQLVLVQRHSSLKPELSSASTSQCTFEIKATPNWYGEIKTYTYTGSCDSQFEAAVDNHNYCSKNHELQAVYLRVKDCTGVVAEDKWWSKLHDCNLGVLSCSNQEHLLDYSVSEQHSPAGTPTTAPAPPPPPPSWSFAMGASDDLLCINGGPSNSGKTEVHELTAASNYKTISHAVSGLGYAGADWEFQTKSNGDLIGILKGPLTGSKKTEVHILSASSNYKDFTLMIGTALHYTDNNPSWAFATKSNGDLMAILKGPKTEVHVLSAADDYQSFSLHANTGNPTDENWEFVTKANGDLVGILKGPHTGSGMTEVHIFSATSEYKTKTLATGTALPYTSDNPYWKFAMKSNGDLVCILKGPSTGSGKTEVHILKAADNYQSFALQTGTGLHTTW